MLQTKVPWENLAFDEQFLLHDYYLKQSLKHRHFRLISAFFFKKMKQYKTFFKYQKYNVHIVGEPKMLSELVISSLIGFLPA